MPWPGPPTLPAVVSVERIASGRSGTWERNKRSYTATWRVITSEPVIGAIEAMGGVFSTLFPIGTPYASFYEYDDFATLAKLTAEPVDGLRTKWIVKGEYDTQEKPGKRLNGPIEQAPTIEWDFGSYDRVLVKDRDGNAIVNSAGHAPDPPYTERKFTLILRYTRNEASYSPLTAIQYYDRINDGPFLGAAAKTVKLNKWLGKQQHAPAVGAFAGGEYWRVEYEFEWNPESWDEVIRDQGMIDKDYKPILAEGQPVTHPVPLQNGYKKTPANPPNYITVKRLALANFGTLNITL